MPSTHACWPQSKQNKNLEETGKTRPACSASLLHCDFLVSIVVDKFFDQMRYTICVFISWIDSCIMILLPYRHVYRLVKKFGISPNFIACIDSAFAIQSCYTEVHGKVQKDYFSKTIWLRPLHSVNLRCIQAYYEIILLWPSLLCIQLRFASLMQRSWSSWGTILKYEWEKSHGDLQVYSKKVGNDATEAFNEKESSDGASKWNKDPNVWCSKY